MPTEDWLDAYYTDVESTPQPGVFLASNGEDSNAAAALRIASTFSGDGVIIQGPPEQLVRLAEKMLDEARMLVVLTNKSPELRRLYGRT